MKQKNIFHVAALIILGAMNIACSSDTNIENANQSAGEKTVILTGTVSAKSNAFTRSVNESGVTKWVAGEKIAIRYQQANNSWATAEATVGTPNTDGSAPITASLTTPQACTVKLVYPASLATDEGEIDTQKLLNNQAGTIDDVSTNWDAATGTANITVNGDVATIPNLTLANQLCICTFTLNVNTSRLEISDGTNKYTVTPASATNKLTVAMLPATAKPFTFTAKVDNNVYEKTGDAVTLAAGKLYKSSPTLALVLSSSSAVGTIGTYKGREAIVATLNGDKYAIALENLATDGATKTAGGHAYYTFADATDPSKTGRLSTSATEWHVPTQAELEGLVTLGGDWDDTNKGLSIPLGTEPNTNTLFLPAVGLATDGVGDIMNAPDDNAEYPRQTGGYYWSSEAVDGNFAYAFEFIYKDWGDGDTSFSSPSNPDDLTKPNQSQGYSVRLFCKLK